MHTDRILRERAEELPPLGRSAEPNAHPRSRRREGGGVGGGEDDDRRRPRSVTAGRGGSGGTGGTGGGGFPGGPAGTRLRRRPGVRGGDLIRSSRRFAPLHPQRRGKAALHPLSPHSALLVPLPIRRSLVFGGVRGERCSGGCGSGCGHGTEGWGGGDQQKVWGTPWGGSEVMEGVGRGLIPPSCCLRGGE